MNAIFSKTLQETETKLQQFILEGTTNMFVIHVLFTIEMLVFILQLKNFP